MQERVKCYTCKGRGYFAVQGFDGNERMECECDGGFVLIGLTDEQITEMDAVETLLDVERHITPVIEVNHPNMTAAFFDDAVRRAHDTGLGMTFTGPETALVASASNPAVRYMTSRTTCSCTGGTTHGRCLHRALFIAYVDVFGATVAEPVAA